MRLAARGERSPVVAFTRSLPSRLSRSAPEFHRVHPPLAAAGSRTVTAGGELHPAPETVCLSARQYTERGSDAASRKLPQIEFVLVPKKPTRMPDALSSLDALTDRATKTAIQTKGMNIATALRMPIPTE
jgi:hypothetical protein